MIKLIQPLEKIRPEIERKRKTWKNFLYFFKLRSIELFFNDNKIFGIAAVYFVSSLGKNSFRLTKYFSIYKNNCLIVFNEISTFLNGKFGLSLRSKVNENAALFGVAVLKTILNYPLPFLPLFLNPLNIPVKILHSEFPNKFEEWQKRAVCDLSPKEEMSVARGKAKDRTNGRSEKKTIKRPVWKKTKDNVDVGVGLRVRAEGKIRGLQAEKECQRPNLKKVRAEFSIQCLCFGDKKIEHLKLLYYGTDTGNWTFYNFLLQNSVTTFVFRSPYIFIHKPTPRAHLDFHFIFHR